MHLKKLTAIISLLSMSSVLTSCSNTVSFPQSQNSVISGDSATAIQDVAQYDNTTQEQSTLPDEFLDDEVSVTSVSPSTSDTAASDSISAWQPYIDESIASHKSFVFSPESMNIDLDIIARLVDADTASSIMAFTGAKSYLDMPLGFTLKSASRVWLNSGLNINLPEDFPEDLAYPIDMSAPDATEIKNKYVADTTDSMITSTPTEFDSETIIDAMNVICFKDSWQGGNKRVLNDYTEFNNADGTNTDDITFISDQPEEGSVVSEFYKTDNAHICVMNYEHDYSLSVILPDEGYSLSDINLISIMQSGYEPENNNVVFAMPEFKTKCDNNIDPVSLSLPALYLREAIAGVRAPILLSQSAYIQVDREGTKAAAVTEGIALMNAMPDFGSDVYMICDRPFFYFIRDNANNEIAFAGAVMNL